MKTVTAFAPGRVNLIGEHLDYNGGQCLPIALPLGTTATLTPCSRLSMRSELGEWTPSDGPAPTWARYILGVLQRWELHRPLQVEVATTVPIGAGLSSSAALTCSVALAASTLTGKSVSKAELVAVARWAESAYVGAPTGGMDQTVSIYARAGHALWLDFADSPPRRDWQAFEPAEVGLSLIVIDSGVRHTLVDSEYGDRRQQCEAAAQLLGLPHLARATLSQVETLPELLRKRARHVVTEQARVTELISALQEGRWAQVGQVLTRSHVSLRDDFEVSCPELDLAVTTCLEHGAYGARMTGGGFGGAAIALVEHDAISRLRAHLGQAFTAAGLAPPPVYAVHAAAGARIVTTS